MSAYPAGTAAAEGLATCHVCCKLAPVSLKFIRGRKGKVTGLELEQFGLEHRAKRVIDYEPIPHRR